MSVAGNSEPSTFWRPAAPEVPSVPPSQPSLSARFADDWKVWGTAAITAGSGLSYLIGVLSISAFARGLHVSTEDLGLGTSDYIFLTTGLLLQVVVITAAALALAFVLRWAQSQGAAQMDSTTNVISAVLSVGLLAFLDRVAKVAGTYGAVPLSGWINAVIMLAIAFIAVLVKGAKRVVAITALAGLLLVLGAFGATANAKDWGQKLGQTEPGSKLPPGPGLLAVVITPATGKLADDTSEQCAIRVRSTVFVTYVGTVITKDKDFVATDSCTSDPKS